MNIPTELREILKQNPTLEGAVLKIIDSLNPIYEDNKLFFFEEYTDHGIRHIENLLSTSALIIEKNTFKRLSAKDIAVYIFAVVLHDIGMHIDYATFISLINGDYDNVKVSSLDSKTWKNMWDEYLIESKRFSSQQKQNIFGNPKVQYDDIDLSDKDKLTGIHKKLIGEFIRRHHPRLAHEIALLGIVGINGNKIDFNSSGLSISYIQISGIIARSHGISIRTTFEYLEFIASDAWRTPDDIYVVFLMVVLRIADYIQIDDSRTNAYLLKIKTFSSPFSLQEHKRHLAIQSLNFKQLDTERIFVTCHPTNSEMFIRITDLITDIQKEFDISWAVLGEIYDYLGSDEKPVIKYRRINSNLNSAKYLEGLDFVPKNIKFKVNDELSKLLVGPLYGNHATFGVRELVQNAVDACLERTFIEKKDSFVPYIKVSINKTTETHYQFCIADNGKGMSIAEIENYFLSIGNSFRKSLTWKKQFIDEVGNSLVNRTGQFGIGILAAFLLGDEINVKTKHYRENGVYSFTTKIDSEYLDIKKDDKSSFGIGTVITINIKKEIFHDLEKSVYLSWNAWYINSFPKVEYFLDNVLVKSKQEIDLSGLLEFKTQSFKSIKWKYFLGQRNYYGYSTNEAMVVCNGIIITKNLRSPKNYFVNSIPKAEERFVIHLKPSIFFDDPNGLFPLKLDRNDIDCDSFPFEKELCEEVCKHYISYLLSLDVDISKNIMRQTLKFHDAQIMYAKDGYAFNFDYFIDRLKNQSNFILAITKSVILPIDLLNLPNVILLPRFNEKINLSYQERNVIPSPSGFALLHEKKYQELFEENTKRLPKWIKTSHFIKSRKSNYVIYEFKTSGQSEIFLDESWIANILESVESIHHISNRSFNLKGGEILNRYLEKYLENRAIIPYDTKERKKLFKTAFAELADYFELHYKENKKSSNLTMFEGDE